MRLSWPLAPLLLAAACAPVSKPPPAPVAQVIVGEDPAWHAIASQEDRQRIEQAGEAWSQAAAQIGQRRLARAQAEEGELLDPEAALARPAPPPGPYVCRTIKLGTQRRRAPAYTAYRPFFCYIEVEDDLLTFVKQTGSQRPAGRFYADEKSNRLVFLGTLGRGNERQAPYGESPDRDMAGIVERVAPFRYRLVIPFPRYESLLDVIELVPFVTDAPTP